MDRDTVLAVRELYRRVPKVNCKRLCGHACRTLIDMSAVERERIETYTGQRLPAWMNTVHNRVCPLLTPKGGCSVYGLRPMVCRVWGATDSPGMICPHGCTVEGEPLSSAEMQHLMLETLRVGGSKYSDAQIAALQAIIASEDGMEELLDRFIDGERSPDLFDAISTKVHTIPRAQTGDPTESEDIP